MKQGTRVSQQALRPVRAPALAIAITWLAVCAPAHAQVVVFDPSNFVQNSLTAARTLEEINNQVRQLQNEAQMLVNEARNLASLPSNVLGQLQSALAQTTRLLNQAQGLAYQVSQAQQQFNQLYPRNYTSGTTGASMLADSVS